MTGTQAHGQAFVGRVTWSFVDQGLSSATNLLLTALVARSVGARQFGAFSVSVAAYLFVLNISRSLATDPLAVRFSHRAPTAWQSATSSATATALMVGTVGGLVTASVGLVVGGAMRGVLLALAVSLPGLLLQDSWRYAFFARGAPRDAALNDGFWAVAQVSLYSLAMLTGRRSAPWLLLMWGASGGLAGLLGAAQARVNPQLHAARRWRREQADLGKRFLAEYLVDGGAAQLGFFLVGAFAGLHAVGAMNGGKVLMGPITVVFLGLGIFAVPEGVALQRSAPDRLMPVFRRLAVLAGAASLVWGAVMMAVPATEGRKLLGASWPAAHRIVWLWALFVAFNGCVQVARAGLRSFGAASTTLRSRIIVAPVGLAAMGIGAAVDGAWGATAGLAISGAFSAVVWWCAFERSHMEVGDGGTRRAGYESHLDP